MTPALTVVPRGMAPHVALVLAGEYDIPGLEGVGEVIDIGANCGAFALWARNRFGAETVYCFEPWPSNYAALVGNVVPDGDNSWARLSTFAVVGRSAPEIYLRPGLHNDGEVSEHDLGEQGSGSGFVAATIHAAKLPSCDFLKVDTGGSELEIVTAYLSAGNKPAAIAYEWHRLSDRTDLHHELVRARYTQVAEVVHSPTRGVAKWLRTDLLD